jgi:DNA-binding FadR family transcriptional regulator
VSRGYGYVQRFVLEELDRQWAGGEPWVDARTLAERLEGQEPTRQRCRSVRRALRLLAADGLVEIGPGAVGRVAAARMDEVAMRSAHREEARERRRQLGSYERLPA